jgi:hypothetical protein
MISAGQLSRPIGLPDAQVIIAVRIDEDHALDPRMVPCAVRRDFHTASTWAREYCGRRVVVICQRGLKLSEGAAAWLRHSSVAAESLEDGCEGWIASGGLLVSPDRMPPRDVEGRTVWVTRARPKVDRIACLWLIRRFLDPAAVFLFVAPAEVQAVADRFGATPFDIDGVFWSHRGELCSFDVMIEEFGLHSAALDRLAMIVRGADTARPDLAPEAPGLLAASLGLSRMFADDLAQLEAGLALYDAFYRWSRDASEETHNWPAAHVPANPPQEKAP